MSVNGVNTASDVQAARRAETRARILKKDPPMFSYTDSYEIDQSNKYLASDTRRKTVANLDALRSQIELHDEWYHAIIGQDYITFTGDGKMTYGELRDKLGIPPRVIRERNGGNNVDADVIKGSIEIELRDIGCFDRRKDEDDAAMTRFYNGQGDYRYGYNHSLSEDEIISLLK